MGFSFLFFVKKKKTTTITQKQNLRPSLKYCRSPTRNCLFTWVQVSFLYGSGAQKIFFAHKFVFVYHVEFLPRGQLLVAHHASEAVQVEHFAAGFADQVVRRDSLQAARAFSAKTPAKHNRNNPPWNLDFHQTESTDCWRQMWEEPYLFSKRT